MRRSFNRAIVLGGISVMQVARVALGYQRRDLHGKRVVITGGARGLGLALAQACARQGASLVLCARDADELARAKRDFLPSGASVETHVCDLEDPVQIGDFLKKVGGPIDLLINNAGVMDVGPLDALEPEDFESALRVNLMAVIRMTLGALPSMGRGAAIVNISSIGGSVAVPHLLPYSTSKFGALGFSLGLDAELAPKGISVTTVLPGLMRTGSFVQASFRGKARQEFNWFALAASLPGASISAASAARQILRAVARRKRFVVLGPQAKGLRILYQLLPGPMLGAMRWVTRLALPSPNRAGPRDQAHKGRDLRQDLPHGGVTRFGDHAGDRLNQNPEKAA